MKLFAAPLQGYTDAIYRHFHAEIFGGVDTYFSPFVRLENGEPKNRDMRDINSEFNANHNLIPQIIFGNITEFKTLADAVIRSGHTHIDLNLGCPFPPQLHKGRGTAVLAQKQLLSDLRILMQENYRDVTFSAKMRLGLKEPSEWRNVISSLNDLPLSHLTVHPRTAAQKYSGELHLDQLSVLKDSCRHKLVINGDILSPSDISSVEAYGVMAGRGLLARPSLFAEYRTGKTLDRHLRIELLLKLHNAIFTHYSATLCGECQILSKTKSFWDYLEGEIGHNCHKAIGKAKNTATYMAAVSSIE